MFTEEPRPSERIIGFFERMYGETFDFHKAYAERDALNAARDAPRNCARCGQVWESEDGHAECWDWALIDVITDIEGELASKAAQ